MSKKIKIGDLEASDVIKDMADALNIDYDVDHNEYCLKIPKTMGSGFIKATCFDHGIGVIESDYLLKKALHIELKKGAVHPLKIMFNRKSDFLHEFKEGDKVHTIKRLESVMLSSAPTNNHLFKIPANTQICIFSLQINRKLFEEKIEAFVSNMNDELVNVFRDLNGINTFYHQDHYSLEIAKFIEEFTQCDLEEDFMKSVFLEGKTYEILTLYLQEYLDNLNTPEKQKILRQSTIESIEKAVKIIKNEIANIDSITVLSKRVGLNQNTLQQGFRHLYKSSVKEFIKNYRLEKAKELLENSDLNVTEITYKIGISSRSYFSKIFKNRFGITPKAYLDKSRYNKSA
ncbi:AraC family transcriptional regulator [Flavivirga sp. 57AJ16]|uniref:helix-turn-helix domain-containing protein n=1 Tax=Flavivirga sp. 57AJ16 TaxID=3025307 RepID=UPI0023665477|nr:AraC family transcriptional regulator [Flavivirga sp. 57AJ16]MDD7885431.1 AraC family transcriptional regulator [Flavivirga sp. 57AJ16]